MAINIQSTIVINCDGPDCDEEITVQDSTQTPPGWLKVQGPTDMLGSFYFHSGACYDRWKANLDAHLQVLETTRREEAQRRMATTMKRTIDGNT